MDVQIEEIDGVVKIRYDNGDLVAVVRTGPKVINSKAMLTIEITPYTEARVIVHPTKDPE